MPHFDTALAARAANGPVVYPLSEGAFTIDSTKLFVPFNNATDDLQQRPVGSLLVEIQPFVVITTSDVLVLDAGLGFTNAEGMLQLHGHLKKLGILPEQVTKVLMSHLHKDHAGGVSYGEVTKQLSFPAAEYYIQKRELDFAFERGFPSYIPEELELLKTAPQVRLLHDDEGQIGDAISYQHTGAHSPHHQVFWIKEKGKTLFFGGDVAPQLQQMKVRYKTKYDFDPEQAMHLRRAWWQQGHTEGWTFLFYHDIKTPVFTAG
ncbi:MAG TPA: MBL fold metallo-hydrolase [Chitinophagaceae bacterium]|nr:MBL fold metallo-hydrolase [Chitinophagaceae bacterium]